MQPYQPWRGRQVIPLRVSSEVHSGLEPPAPHSIGTTARWHLQQLQETQLAPPQPPPQQQPMIRTRSDLDYALQLCQTGGQESALVTPPQGSPTTMPASPTFRNSPSELHRSFIQEYPPHLVTPPDTRFDVRNHVPLESANYQTTIAANAQQQHTSTTGHKPLTRPYLYRFPQHVLEGGVRVFLDPSPGKHNYGHVRKPEISSYPKKQLVSSGTAGVSKPPASVKKAKSSSKKHKASKGCCEGCSKRLPVPTPPLSKLTAYNFFFREERDRIIQDIGESEPYDLSEAKKQALLGQQWRRGVNERRKHRKTHGKVTFDELSSTISRRWRTLPEHVKAFFKELGAIDTIRYKTENKEFQAFLKDIVQREADASSDGSDTGKP